MRRRSLSQRVSRKDFRRHSGTHKKNLVNPRKMRGGIRL